jgi:hypothetical protein
MALKLYLYFQSVSGFLVLFYQKFLIYFYSAVHIAMFGEESLSKAKDFLRFFLFLYLQQEYKQILF